MLLFGCECVCCFERYFVLIWVWFCWIWVWRGRERFVVVDRKYVLGDYGC